MPFRLTLFCVAALVLCSIAAAADERPNIFIAISDDQSWLDASAYGSKMAITPNFDRVAKEGVLFTQAFCPSPGCSPSRAAFLTGLNTWQIEHAGTHASYFDPKYETFPKRLAAAGYFVGHTGKGWGPGDARKLGWPENPAGPKFGGKGYAGAFEKFLSERPKDQPFCFWFGSSDPHRGYAKGSGLKKGKKLEDAEVPPFLPDTPEIRSDMLDYAFEVERFDDDLGKMLALLEESGELDNTLLIVTSDNGCPIPRAKANCYEHGIHMPLAIRFGKKIPAGRVVDDLVGFTDLTATIYDITGAKPSENFELVGESIRNILESEESGVVDASRTAVYSARERHSSSRFNSLSYPQRCIRTHDYLLIINFHPERWPAGPGQKFDRVVYDKNGDVVSSKLSGEHSGYHDIDACPSLTFLIQNSDNPEIAKYLDLAVARRPKYELFDIRSDPGCLHNLAGQDEFAKTEAKLRTQLETYLKQTGDNRITGEGDIWETYPRVSHLRWFPTPDWAKENPDAVPNQPWLEQRRPRK